MRIHMGYSTENEVVKYSALTTSSYKNNSVSIAGMEEAYYIYDI